MSYTMQRKYSRASLAARVIAHDNQDVAYLSSGTISEGGVFLHGSYALWTPGTVLRLNIKSRDLPEAFLAEGEVLSYSGRGEKGLCIKFIRISQDVQKVINSYVYSRTAEHVKPAVQKPPAITMQKPAEESIDLPTFSRKDRLLLKGKTTSASGVKSVKGGQAGEEVKTLSTANIRVPHSHEHNFTGSHVVPFPSAGESQRSKGVPEKGKFQERVTTQVVRAKDFISKKEGATGESDFSKKDQQDLKEYVDASFEEQRPCLSYSPESLHEISTFRVFINGKMIPANEENGWSYDAGRKVILFNGEHVPAENDTIVFAFKHRL